MKRLAYILTVVLLALGAISCEHKELCIHHREHAHKFHIEIVADYRCDWEEHYDYIDWSKSWPDNYIDYDGLRPSTPKGLRVINYNENLESNTHNISAEGGVVTLYEGPNDILLYNNDTEYILFQRQQNGNKATTRATTRTRTRATYVGSEYTEKGEETMTPPDMLFANYIEGYVPEKSIDPVEVPVTLQPLVYTYKIRYEFLEEDGGLEYVAYARGALSGMAASVLMDSGETSAEGATLIFDNCEVTDYGVRALVTSFGIPGFPNENYLTRVENRKNGLNLEVILRNGKLLNFNFDVTEQVQKQPHGGVIVVSGIQIKPEDGTQGSGAFDVDVNGWADYEDIILPLL